MMFVRSLLSTVLCALLLGPVPQEGTKTPGVEAPKALTLPACVDVHGQKVDWDAYAGRSIILYFHKVGMKYSERALRELLTKYHDHKDSVLAGGMVVVNFSSGDTLPLQEMLVDLHVPAVIVSDPEREAFRDYRVVAFPTAYVLDRDRHLVKIMKGYGPHFVSRTLLSSRYGAGLIDEARFQGLLDGKDFEHVDSVMAALERNLVVVGRIAAWSSAAKANEKLQEILAGISAPEAGEVGAEQAPYLKALDVSARLQIKMGDLDRAVELVERLRALAPDYPKLFLLDSRLAIAHEDWAAASKALQGSRERIYPEVTLLRARILRAQGEIEAAIELMDQILERLVVLDQMVYL
jgi:peroxiredoxin